MRRCRITLEGRRNVRRLAVVLSMSCCVQPALAQEPTEARLAADVMFERGKAALLAGDWTAGCEMFRQSQAVDPSASTLIKLARCHEHAGQFNAARVDYDRALVLIRLRPENDDHARELLTLVVTAKSELERRFGRLQIRLSPDVQQFAMKLDGEALEPTVALSPLVLDPGSHRISVTAAGYQTSPVQLTVTEGEVRQLTLELKPNPIPTAKRPPTAKVAIPSRTTIPSRAVTPTTTTAKSNTGPGRRVLAITSAGAGGLLLGVAGYYAIKTRRLVQDTRSNDDCDGNYNCNAHGMELLDEADEAQTTAIVLGLAGAFVTGLGVVLWTTTPSEQAPAAYPRAALHVGPTGVHLGGHW